LPNQQLARAFFCNTYVTSHRYTSIFEVISGIGGQSPVRTASYRAIQIFI
jgi:hypothetical protein